jgi:dolichol-phosphate mannosyltransferase
MSEQSQEKEPETEDAQAEPGSEPAPETEQTALAKPEGEDDAEPAPAAKPLEKLSIVIPAYNEEGCIEATVEHLRLELDLHKIPHEIVVVDDNSSDGTWEKLQALKSHIPELAPVKSPRDGGFGNAIQSGLEVFTGDAVVIMMADESDDCRDVVQYWQKLNEGWDCVMGSRFISGGGTIDYPTHKYIFNRMANTFLRYFFAIKLNDTTNAFKAYRREVIEGIQPILSPHFNITVEIPLKAIVRGYSWTVVPIIWRNRRAGFSKLKIKEMGSRYLFIALYVWLEKYFSRGDYRKDAPRRRPTPVEGSAAALEGSGQEVKPQA